MVEREFSLDILRRNEACVAWNRDGLPSFAGNNYSDCVTFKMTRWSVRGVYPFENYEGAALEFDSVKDAVACATAYPLLLRHGNRSGLLVSVMDPGPPNLRFPWTSIIAPTLMIVTAVFCTMLCWIRKRDLLLRMATFLVPGVCLPLAVAVLVLWPRDAVYNGPPLIASALFSAVAAAIPLLDIEWSAQPASRDAPLAVLSVVIGLAIGACALWAPLLRVYAPFFAWVFLARGVYLAACPLVRPHLDARSKPLVETLCLPVGLCVVAILVAGSFPPFWNMNFGPHATYPSPSALLLVRTSWEIDGCPSFLANRPTHFDPCAHAPEVTCVFIWKLFPDVAIFYGFLVGLFVMARIAAAARPFAVMLSLWMVLLVVLWSTYWLWIYCRLAYLDFLERCARGLGHVANLMLVLLLWSRCVRTVWQPLHVTTTVLATVHHYLGLFFAISLGAHVALWTLSWALSGKLLNLVSPAFDPYVGDFSVSLMSGVTLVFVAPILLSSLPRMRTVAFWLFWAIHRSSAYVISLAALGHSWALWVFLWPPLALLVVEHAMTLFDSRQESRLEHVDTSYPGYLVISIHAPLLVPRLRAGHYVKLMVPEISPFQWHPFSFVRGHGADLQLFVRSSCHSWWQQQLNPGMKCHLCGPFGVLDIRNLVDLDRIVIVAGGSGLAAVAALASQMDFERPVVHVVFIEKTLANFGAFEWLWTENPTLIPHLCVGRTKGLECALELLKDDGDAGCRIGCFVSGPQSLHDELRPMAKQAHVTLWHEFAFEV